MEHVLATREIDVIQGTHDVVSLEHPVCIRTADQEDIVSGLVGTDLDAIESSFPT